MTGSGIGLAAVTQILVYLSLLTVVAIPLGNFMARVYQGERHGLSWALGGLERGIYRLARLDPAEEMGWRRYAAAAVFFNLIGVAIVWLLQIIQAWLPLNPEHLPNVPWVMAFNTAVGFVTNTSWQSYSGESTMSYFTQVAALAVQNFFSAATGMAVAVAVVRGFTRKLTPSIGNFWADFTRSVVYVLLPISLLMALVLIAQGGVQSFAPYAHVRTLEGAAQTIPLGPAASQVVIRQLGSSGGGFFGANGAHPFENPTPLTNFMLMFSTLMIPAAMIYMFGKMIGSIKQGWSIFNAMMTMLVAGVALAFWAESQGNPLWHGLPFLEGKELRFGVGGSALWGVTTTAASNGSVNAMHDSFSPLGGFVLMLNMMLGEVVFGGVGAGLYGMLMFVIITVFVCGLMIGRTPEYLGKKIEAREVVCAVAASLGPGVVTLLCSALAIILPVGLASLGNHGPHGLSEVLYDFSSATGNNGSAFGGLNTNTNFYNLLLSAAMFAGRFIVIVPVLAVAGAVAAKKTVVESMGTFPTDGFLFSVLLIFVVAIAGALTFFPALALGPVAEHFLMLQGRTF